MQSNANDFVIDVVVVVCAVVYTIIMTKELMGGK